MWAWVAAAALLGACAREPTPAPVSAAHTAVSRDGKVLYAVDSERDVVRVLDARTTKKLAEVRVGKAPERVVVGPDDRLYVSNRGERSVSVIRRGEWTEQARIPVGVEPIGMAVSPDNTTLYVVNASSMADAEHGTLAAVDLVALRKQWEVQVGKDPKGVVLLGEGRAAVTHRNSQPLTVDLGSPRVLDGGAQPEGFATAQAP